MFKRFVLIILIVLLCVSMMGCRGIPQGSARCKTCNDDFFSFYDKGWIMLDDRIEYYDEVNKTATVIRVERRQSKNHGEVDMYYITYQMPDGARTDFVVSADKIRRYDPQVGEQPYIEWLTEYGEYWECSKCGAVNYNWKVEFYRLYMFEEDIIDVKD